MAGRKVFTSGEILTAADVNSYLMDQVVAVFADSTARSSAIPTPTEGMVTYVEDANRVEVYDGSAFGPVGTILQLVEASSTTGFTTTSATFVDVTGLTLSITPTSATSKILVFFSGEMNYERATSPSYILQIADGSDSPISGAEQARSLIRDTSGNATLEYKTLTAFDSPGSTASKTYKIRLSTSGTVAMDNNLNTGRIIAMEVAA